MVRINGRELQLDFTENYCATCSRVSGTDTNCRVWLYRGEEYTAPPKAMIIEAVLQEVYGTSHGGPRRASVPSMRLLT